MAKKLSKKEAEKLWEEFERNRRPLSDDYPEGFFAYYEGKDFNAFAAEMVEKFGFNPWDKCNIYFYIPPYALDAVYGSGDYPLGS